MKIVTELTAGRSGYLSLFLAVGLVLAVLAALRRTITIVAVLSAACAAMLRQRLSQGGACPVEPDTKCVAVKSQIGCHAFATLFAEIDASDQFGVDRAQFGNQPAMAGAQPRHLRGRIDNPFLWFARRRRRQSATPGPFTVVIVQRRPQDCIQPGIHSIDVSELILARKHTDGEVLQHILCFCAVAKPFDQKPQKGATSVQQSTFRRSVVPLRFTTVLRCHDVPALSAYFALSSNNGLIVASSIFNAGER